MPSPRVPQLEDTFLLVANSDFPTVEDTVGVGGHQTETHIAIALFGRTSHQMFALQMRTDELPGSLGVDGAVGVSTQVLEWSSCESVHRCSRQSRLDNLIRAEQFCICFFDQNHPEFIVVGSGENGTAIHNRNSVVDDDALPKSIDEEPNSIGSVRRLRGGFEDPFHNERVLADGGQGREQVAIAESALLDVLGLDESLEDEIVALHELGGTQPLDLFGQRLETQTFDLVAELSVEVFVVLVETAADVEFLVTEHSAAVFVFGDEVSHFAFVSQTLPFEVTSSNFECSSSGRANRCFSIFSNVFFSGKDSFLGTSIVSSELWHPPIAVIITNKITTYQSKSVTFKDFT